MLTTWVEHINVRNSLEVPQGKVFVIELPRFGCIEDVWITFDLQLLLKETFL